MKTAFETLFNSNVALATLASSKMKMLGALALKDVINKVNDATKAAREMRETIIADQIEKDEAGEPKHPEGNAQLVTLTAEGRTNLKDLMAAEIDLPFEKINPAIFGNDVECTTAILMQLDWLIGA